MEETTKSMNWTVDRILNQIFMTQLNIFYRISLLCDSKYMSTYAYV